MWDKDLLRLWPPTLGDQRQRSDTHQEHPARKFCSVKKLAGFLLRVSFSSEISVTKVLVFLVSFDSHSILDILFGTHGHSDGHPGPSKKTIPSIQVGIRRFMLRSSKVASI